MLASYQGDHGTGRAFCAESLAIRRELGDRRGIAGCLEALAGVAGAQGQHERAARLFGAAAALRESIGAPLPPADSAEIEPRVAAVRAALGEEAFTAAWAAARAMSLEEAVTDASNAACEGKSPGPQT
jgi:hypothetical protein